MVCASVIVLRTLDNALLSTCLVIECGSANLLVWTDTLHLFYLSSPQSLVIDLDPLCFTEFKFLMHCFINRGRKNLHRKSFTTLSKMSLNMNLTWVWSWMWVWANSEKEWRTGKPGGYSPWGHKELDTTWQLNTNS